MSKITVEMDEAVHALEGVPATGIPGGTWFTGRLQYQRDYPDGKVYLIYRPIADNTIQIFPRTDSDSKFASYRIAAWYRIHDYREVDVKLTVQGGVK